MTLLLRIFLILAAVAGSTVAIVCIVFPELRIPESHIDSKLVMWVLEPRFIVPIIIGFGIGLALRRFQKLEDRIEQLEEIVDELQPGRLGGN